MRISCLRGGLAKAEAGREAASLYGPHRRLDRKELQIARVDNPRR